MNHEFQPQEPTCEVCGMEALDHYWACKKHNSAGNGAFNCYECFQEDVDEQLK